MRRLFAILSIAFLLTAPAAQADTVNFSAPDFDRWMYPFNFSTPGFRTTAPAFGAVGTPGFDEFDGQVLVGFDTETMGVPTSATLPPGTKYQINSVTVTATHFSGNFTYDPTFDPYQTHLDISDPDFVPDADSGRPIELYGVGLRGTYTSLEFGPTTPGGATFEERDLFGPPGGGQGVRYAYAHDPSVGDVSNPVTNRHFGVESWAIGQTGLAPGSTVLDNTTFSFSLDLSRPEIVNYIKAGLSHGGLFFSLVSLVETSQTNPGNPNFYMRENSDLAAIPATLTLDYSVVPVPEPATWALAACGAGLALPYWWRRRRAARAKQP